MVIDELVSSSFIFPEKTYIDQLLHKTTQAFIGNCDAMFDKILGMTDRINNDCNNDAMTTVPTNALNRQSLS